MPAPISPPRRTLALTNEHRLRGILERLPMGLALVEPSGRIAFRNQRFVEICGYTEAEVPDVDTWWQRAFRR